MWILLVPGATDNLPLPYARQNLPSEQMGSVQIV